MDGEGMDLAGFARREIVAVREFADEGGAGWVAGLVERPGPDHKGRFRFVARPAAGGVPVLLHDVQWNSEKTARRTLDTMSEVELRRRLRWAVGRSGHSSRSVSRGP